MGTDVPADARPPDHHESVVRWHAMTTDEAVARLLSDRESGLPDGEAARRLGQYGANAIPARAPRGPWRMLLGQFTDLMILVLIGAAIVSGVIGDAKDTIVILVIVLLNGIAGFVQEYRAERAMVALRRLSAATATVVRNDRRCGVPAVEIVPGDIVLLEAGNIVPADLRLLEAARLKVSEATLTGESVPVDKHEAPLPEPELPLGDRANMAFKSTVVTYGRGRGIVVATGAATEFGRIAGLLEAAPEVRTPLQRRLTVFGRQLALAILAICAVVFAAGLLRHEPPLLMFLTALSLAVAAIPEALPAVITVLLALGARKMARHQALIRRLPAVETLGSVTYICADKTGTLTQNEMRVAQMHAGGKVFEAGALDPGGEPGRRLLAAIALCNDAGRGADGRVVGDPTETALWLAATEAGLDIEALKREAPRVMELPFDSDRKRMTTLHGDGAAFMAYTKGAPESVLPRCNRMMTATGEVDLLREVLLAAAEAMAQGGLRVLAVAARRWPALPGSADVQAIESDLTLLGLVGLIDPPRPEAREAVALCRSAGITPVMITGDHPATARAIARQLGILEDDGMVLTGQALARLSDPTFAARVAEVRVYARVSPAQKIRIVEALQKQGAFVAMTGDGVNDAPALARADIGVAMGKGGTDVAREAASLVLLDDNFATIVAAVREGRRIFDNIRKFVKYVITCNAAEIWTILLAPFLGLPIPLAPIQILWINLVTDGLPGLALAAEPAERGIMERPPRPPEESLFARGMWQHMVWVGLLMAGVTLLTQAYAIQTGSSHWQTMVFTVLTLAQMGQVLAIRSERESLFRQGVLSNPLLLATVIATFLLQLMVIYLPFFNVVFDTAPLTLGELVLCIAASATVFVAVEVEKALRRRGWFQR